MGQLDGKVALITGAGRGMGKAMALRFAGEGADIVANDVTAANVERTVAEVKSLGRKAIAAPADVSRKTDVERMVAQAIDTFGKIDILVNNAGITRHAPLLEMTEADWDLVMTVDLKSVFLCTQAVARHMIKRKYGKIVNISSAAALGSAEPNVSNYASAKAGVAMFTKISARAFGQYGINVNSIAPGMVLTEISHHGRTPEELAAMLENRKKQAVLGRVGTPEDIANLALFLASESSSFITGQIIACDGGRTDKL